VQFVRKPYTTPVSRDNSYLLAFYGYMISDATLNPKKAANLTSLLEEANLHLLPKLILNSLMVLVSGLIFYHVVILLSANLSGIQHLHHVTKSKSNVFKRICIMNDICTTNIRESYHHLLPPPFDLFKIW
jgi:hypothetical protein